MEKDGPSKWLRTPLQAYETDTISGLLTLSFKLRAAERESTWKLGFPITFQLFFYLNNLPAYLYHYSYLLSESALTNYQVPLTTRSLIPHTCSHQQVPGWSHSMITAVLAGSNRLFFFFFYQPWASTALVSRSSSFH